MKRFILTMFMLVGTLAVFSVSGNAQVTRRYSASIPFDFSVGKKHLKAGEYTVGPVGTLISGGFIMLTERSTGRSQLVGQTSFEQNGAGLTGKMQFISTGAFAAPAKSFHRTVSPRTTTPSVTATRGTT